MSLAIVRSDSLLLRGPRDKWGHIRQIPELADGSVMALLAPWCGQIDGILKGQTGREEVRDLERVKDSCRRIERERLELTYSWDSKGVAKTGRLSPTATGIGWNRFNV